MRVPNESIRYEICGTLTEFYCEVPSKQQFQGEKEPTSFHQTKHLQRNTSGELIKKNSILCANVRKVII